MRRKHLATIPMLLSLSLAMAQPTFAGEWKQDSKGWWYQNTNGTYPANTWKWIDSNHDSGYERYYFDNDGYCLMDTTTPDGYQVNSQGAWVHNGMVVEQGADFDILMKRTNDIAYSEHDIEGIVDRNLSPTYLCIYEKDGTPVASSYRPQTTFDVYNGCPSGVTGLARLEKNKEYYIEGIITAYSRGGLQLDYPRTAAAFLMNGINASPVMHYDLDISPLTPVNSVNQSSLEIKQVVEGTMSGDILKSGDKRQASFLRGNSSYTYTYTGVCFRSNTFKITDDMPNKGLIAFSPMRSFVSYNSNEAFPDDYLDLNYVISGSQEEAQVQQNIPKEDTAVKIPLEAKYDDRGINLTVLDMLESTKEENAAKYIVVSLQENISYDTGSPVTTETILYANGVYISYNVKNEASGARLAPTFGIDHQTLFQHAPALDDFPISYSEQELKEKLKQYAESLGFTFDGFGYITNDGNKTYRINSVYGSVGFLYNSEDGISIDISGLGKDTDYYIYITKIR